jgi:PIN domain nuclease of toxin-antitoxin system
MRLLLDTCTFLWIASESPKVSKAAITAFLDRRNERYLSTASVWEIAIKYSTGKLKLPSRPERFIPQIRETSGIDLLDLDEDSALTVAKLPWIHRDPFDRVLVAQALVHGMTLLTSDDEIEQYAVRTLW